MDEGKQKFDRLDRLLCEALEIDPRFRPAYVKRVCGDDLNLMIDLNRLLHQAEDEDGLLGTAGALGEPLLLSVVPSGDRETLPAGTRLGPYEIRSLLGAGGMGQVFRARDTRLQREVALKVLDKRAHGTTLTRRFEREARAASALNHPNIVTVHDVGDTEDFSYIAMEYVRGESLQQRLDRRSVDLDEALALASQIAAGLTVAHETGIVHRDLKPGNIMITEDGTPKIVDFGLAKMGQSRGPTARTLTVVEPLTAKGLVFGTLAYMSPEQASAKEVDHRSDLFSFGSILYETVTGRRPFSRPSEAEVLAAILKETPQPVGSINPAVPAEFCAIVERCLRKAPGERFETTRELLQALADVCSNRSGIRANASICSVCGVGNSPDHRYCRQCGQPIVGGPTAASRGGVTGSVPSRSRDSVLAGEKRPATVLVTRLVDYETLVESVAPDEIESTLADLELRFREVIGRHGGHIDRVERGEVVALFGIPTAREDDPARATRAAMELASGQALAIHGAETIRPMSAIHTGPVVVQTSPGDAGRSAVSGTTVQLAVGLALTAGPGQVLLSPETRRLVGASVQTRELTPIRLRQDSKPLAPHLALSADESTTPPLESPGTPLTPFSGRQEELERILDGLRAVSAGEGRFFALVGDAGAGKTRLLYELRCQVAGRDFDVFEGRCQSHGGGVPYLPLIQATRALLGLKDHETPREKAHAAARAVRAIDSELGPLVPLYVHILSLPNDDYPLPDHVEGKPFRHAVQEALAALFTLASSRRPIVLLLEDWHWADVASHEAIRQFAELCPDYSLLIAVSYRPEASPDWSGVPVRTVRLAALPASSAERIMCAVLGADRLPRPLVSKIHERTAGNPFYIEEVCRTLVEEHKVVVENGVARVSGSLDRLQLPDSVQAVIRTRLDRLPVEAQDLLRQAAVIGREFSIDVVRRLADSPDRLEDSLEALTHRGLIRRVRVVPQAVFRFQHALTQEVAYDSLLLRQKKTLHGRVGELLATLLGARLEDHYDDLARHFGMAERWDKAVHYVHKSARRSIGLSQFPDALRALDLARGWLERIPVHERQDEPWAEVLIDEARVCDVLGERERQQTVLDEVLERLENVEHRAEHVIAHISRAELRALTGEFAAGERDLDTALAISLELNDRDLERDVLRGLAFLYWRQQRNEDALEVLERTLRIDRKMGIVSRIVGDLTNRGSALRGLGRYDEALESLEEALSYRDTPGIDPLRTIEALYVLHTVYRDRGDIKRAERRLRDAIGVHERELYAFHQQVFHYSALANILLERGETEEALALLSSQVEHSRRIRYAFGLSGCLQNLAQVLSGLGRNMEALPHFIEAAETFRRMHEPVQEREMLEKTVTILDRHRSEVDDFTWHRAMTLGRDGHHTGVQIAACRGLAAVASNAGDPAQAILHLRDGLQFCDTDRPAKRGELLNDIGVLEWEAGRIEQALECYRQALELFRATKDDLRGGLVLNSMGACLVALGRHAEATDNLNEAIELHRRTRQPLMEGHAESLLGDAALGSGDPETAIDHYQNSLEIRRRVKDRRGEGWMHHHLARAFLARKDAGRAARHAEFGRAIAEELGDGELSRACLDLEVS